MSLSKYGTLNAQRCHVTERIHITSNTKSLILQPKTRDELCALIEQELDRQGPDVDLNFIDTSEITDMSMLFHQLDIRNIKIDEWDVSNVTNMAHTFSGCTEFSCDLSYWDVSNVTNMNGMFINCKVFEGTGLNNWNVPNVKRMNSTFYGCTKLNVDLSHWDVSKVLDNSFVFHHCYISDDYKPQFKN